MGSGVPTICRGCTVLFSRFMTLFLSRRVSRSLLSIEIGAIDGCGVQACCNVALCLIESGATDEDKFHVVLVN